MTNLNVSELNEEQLVAVEGGKVSYEISYSVTYKGGWSGTVGGKIKF